MQRVFFIPWKHLKGMNKKKSWSEKKKSLCLNLLCWNSRVDQNSRNMCMLYLKTVKNKLISSKIKFDFL